MANHSVGAIEVAINHLDELLRRGDGGEQQARRHLRGRERTAEVVGEDGDEAFAQLPLVLQLGDVRIEALNQSRVVEMERELLSEHFQTCRLAEGEGALVADADVEHPRQRLPLRQPHSEQ